MNTLVLFAGIGQALYCLVLFLTALFLILLILIQRGRGGGLSGAFGGMGGQSAFGTKAGDTFTKVTIVAATVWILLCMAGVKFLGQQKGPLSGNTAAGFSAAPAEPGTDEASPLNTASDDLQADAAPAGDPSATGSADGGAPDGGATGGATGGDSPPADSGADTNPGAANDASPADDS